MKLKSIDPVVFAPAVSWAYRGLCATIRYTDTGWERVEPVFRQKRPVVVAIWHNELFCLPYYGMRRKLECVNVVSQSKDGEILARALENLGFVSARGSSTRGGLQALRSCIKIMREQNRLAVITVDGPKGPRHKAKQGVFLLAQKAGALLVPLRLVVNRKFVFEKAWDKFQLPYPFSACQVRIGEPIEVSKEKMSGAVLEREQARLEKALHDLA